MKGIHVALAVAVGVLVASVAIGADRGCPDPHARDFNFWIGYWSVTNADGSLAGHNQIEPILDGCVLQETWAGVSGSAGTSLNFYDTSRREWRQFWVWREGTTLELAGRLVDGAMILQGDSLEDGKPVRNRITWTDPPGDTVRQLWELSRDGGKTWNTLFDGTYRPARP
ncbi:MAG: hypothetical protein R3F24_09170 [Gammaproteobacteria bacterium]